MKRVLLFAVLAGSLSLSGCGTPRPYGDPGYHGRGAVNDEAHFKRLLANEQNRYQAEQRRTEVGRDHDIAQARTRLRFRPPHEVEQEVSRIQNYYHQRLENERIAHEHRMNNILVERDQQRNRRAIDGIFSFPPFRR